MIEAFLALGLLLPLSGVLKVARQDQASRDRQRKTYILHFPSDMSSEAVTSWIRAISGTLRPGTFQVATPSLVFEVWSTSNGIKHLLKVPWQHADYIMSQLLAHIPGLSYTPETENIPRRLWTRAVEVGMSNRARPLRIHDGSALSSSILASMQSMGEGEAVVMQYVVVPAPPSKAPIDGAPSDRMMLSANKADKDEIAERRAKLAEPNVFATLRVGATANTPARAEHLIYRVRSAVASSQSSSTRFTKRVSTLAQLQKRIDKGATPVKFGLQLSAPELASLIAFPIGSPFISGLPPAMARRLPTPATVPTTGRVLGRSNMPGAERNVALAYADALRHVHVFSGTGAGKSALLANLFRQDVEHGYGAIVIETKGDLFHSALDYVPWERLDDVIVMDVNDRKNPVGFNILQQGKADAVVDEIGGLFQKLYGDTGGVYSREVLYHSLRTLITDPKLTFVDIVPLLTPQTTEEIKWSDELKRSLKDPELKAFWQRFDNKGQRDLDRFAQPVLDRVWQLNARPEIKRIIGQSGSTFNLQDVVRENKILLVNLSGLPKDTASLVGTLIVNALWSAIRTERAVKPNFLYLDEFQTMVNLPIDAEEFITKSRSMNLGLVLAHQHMNQLPTDLRIATMANVGTRIVFQLGADDAQVIERDFAPHVSREDLQHTKRFDAFARIATAEGISTPVSLTTLAPSPGYKYSKELVQRSRARYGRPIEQVDKEILERRRVSTRPSARRPKISGFNDENNVANGG